MKGKMNEMWLQMAVSEMNRSRSPFAERPKWNKDLVVRP